MQYVHQELQTMPRSFHLCTALALLFAPLTAAAQSPDDFVGTWAMRLADRNLFVLILTDDQGAITGALERPGHISIEAAQSHGPSIFSAIGPGARRDNVVKSTFVAGALHLTFQNSADPNDQDNFIAAQKGEQLVLSFADLPPNIHLDPLVFVHAPKGASIATDFDPNRQYTVADHAEPNAEMKAIFDEDQRVRQTDKIDWSVVSKSDFDRREQTNKLLAAGSLHTGKDFEEAAFIFQHGDKPDDYLLAHTLAMVAIAKGDSTAIWIAAATLDRYLQNIKQKQILGTQYLSDTSNHWTQEPYDRTLVSDALRAELRVESQAEQTKRLQSYQTQK